MTKPKGKEPAKTRRLSGAAARSANGEKLGGRPKGSPNKVTKAIKDAAIGALNAGDGAEAFFKTRKAESPDAFMAFLKSIVPHEVAIGGIPGSPIETKPDLSGLTEAQLEALAAIKR